MNSIYVLVALGGGAPLGLGGAPLGLGGAPLGLGGAPLGLGGAPVGLGGAPVGLNAGGRPSNRKRPELLYSVPGGGVLIERF